ncbi:MAG: DUF3098 domain-containing protein [Bacteroidota bacterium]
MKNKDPKLKDNPRFPLGPENYRLLAIGFGIIVIGFLLMVGGGSDDPEVFNPEIFNFRRITLAPMVLLAGFIFQIYAIMKKGKSEEKTN